MSIAESPFDYGLFLPLFLFADCARAEISSDVRNDTHHRVHTDF